MTFWPPGARKQEERQILWMWTQCWNTKECGRACICKEPRQNVQYYYFFYSGVIQFFGATWLRLFCVYSSCMEHAHLVNCSTKSQSVTDWSEAPSQHCVCHKLGGGSTWWRLSRTNTNSCTFSGQQTEQQKQEAGLPETRMLGLCSKINN